MLTVLMYLAIVLAVIVVGIMLLRFEFGREKKYLGGVAKKFGLAPTYTVVFGLTHPIFGRRVPRVQGVLNGRALVIENWVRSSGTGSSRNTQQGFTVSVALHCDPQFRLHAGDGERALGSGLAKAALAFGRASGQLSESGEDDKPGDADLDVQLPAAKPVGWASSNAPQSAQILLSGAAGVALRDAMREHSGRLKVVQARLEYTQNIRLGWNAKLQHQIQALIPLLGSFATDIERIQGDGRIAAPSFPETRSAPG